MGKRLLILSVVVVVAAATSTAAAAPPKHVAYPANFVFPIPELGALCGFDVSLVINGTYKGTVFYDKSGAIIKEIDTQPGTKISWSSSTTGRSFAYPFSAVLKTEYPYGTAPGSPAVAYGTGMGEKMPGLPASAGRLYFPDATVLFLSADGVPIVDYGLPSTTRGHANAPEAVDAAICAALAP
jgi:hypothetical protein